MNSGHAEVRTLMGGYVLGGLDESERRLFEAHLAECAACRDELAGLTPLPGLLRRAVPAARPDDADAGRPAGRAPGPERPEPPEPPEHPQGTSPARQSEDGRVSARDASLERLLDGVRRQTAGPRRRGRPQLRLLAPAAALVAAALLGGVLVRTGQPDGPPPLAFVAAGGTDVAGEAKLTAKPWGTAVDLDLRHLPATGSFTLRVADDDGRTQQAAAWGATPGTAARVTGASSVHPGHIRTLSVLDHSGRVLATVHPS
ncbi:zf-HC2 domain-containing protein [Streptomyces sp. NPDC047002]|uniref:zf-HC2 domain-containing protein n=1 Tax=Streptomyces sp. NPDC047002 TaxID=3155475 RepID=UPI003453F724